jgi:hypothetical protein
MGDRRVHQERTDSELTDGEKETEEIKATNATKEK